MDPNSNSITPEQIASMQQRLFELERFAAANQAQPSAEPPLPSSPDVMTDSSHDATPLHSLEVRPTYSWFPSPFLTEVLSLDTPLFPSTMLPDEERRKMIEKYPNIEDLQYQPPDTIPLAARKMNKYQSKQGMSLKRLQYLLSGVFRPLDVLGLEISKSTDTVNTQCYLYMLRDCRQLILNVSAQINDMRNNIAFQAVNPSFTSSNSTNSTNFTMSPADFQAALVQQTSSAQAVKNASQQRNKRRPFSQYPNQQSYQPPPQQFFRSGPSSQQGGYTANNNGPNNNNSTTWHNKHNNSSSHQNNSSNFNKQRNNTNPFRNNNEQ